MAANVSMSRQQVDAYRRDGFVHLRGVLDERWLEVLRAAIRRVEEEAAQRPRIMNLTAARRAASERRARADREVETATSDYLLANNAWQWNDALREVAFASPLCEWAAALMGSNRIRFYFDQVFIKPPGSQLRTEFHQDLGYWTCTGEEICTFWVPIERVTKDTGAMGYVPGSHRWDARYKANLFVDRAAIRGQQGEDLPDILADEARYGVVYCDCEPGDVIVHHVRTIHGATGNTTNDRWRRSAAFRFTGDDVVYHHPPGIPANSTPISAMLKDGDPLSGDADLFPLLWPRRAGA